MLLAQEMEHTNDPAVLCVMLACGRQQMVDRAIRCFNRQTYPHRILVVVDTSLTPLEIPVNRYIHHTRLGPSSPPRSIGALRNIANCLSVGGALNAPIIAHWDSDDYSAPVRLVEQVKLLVESQKPAVGYNQIAFLDVTKQPPETWLYTSQHPTRAVGTSLMYWRATWQKRPFPDLQIGEDQQWMLRVPCAVETSVRQPVRMIATIHGRNTSSRIDYGAAEWSRAQMLDVECWRALAL
jgi:hypothetical protein